MISLKTIKLYVYVDGINDVPFYGDVSSAYEEFILANGELFQTANGFIFNVRHTNEQIEIGSFRYDAKRMGGAPTISFTLMYEDCLDNFWGENVYAVFNGEKYFLKQTPTSSLSNEDARYKHDVELISERVALDNVYFFDAVVGAPQESDKPVSNSSKVVFFGDIHEFAHRMNASLEYTKLLKWEDGVDDEGNAIKIANGYNIVVDEGITSEEKLMSFEDQFFSNVLQEIYNTYEVPYYFVGKTIHIGFANDAVVPPTFAYGVDDALLSITKNNANYKIVNRATGTGSSDNIPYYYPNNSPKGVIAAVSSNPNIEAKVLDYELYADKVKLDGVVRKSNIKYANVKVTHTAEEEIVSGQTFSAQMGGGGKGTSFYISFDAEEAGIFLLNFSSEVFRFLQNGVEKDDATIGVSYGITLLDETDSNKIVGDTLYKDYNVKEIDNYEVPIPFANHKYKIRVEVSYSAQGKYSGKAGQIVFDASYSFGGTSGWMYEDKVVELKDLGLFVEGDSQSGDTITQKLVEYINTSQNLMPYKYRETKGKERFYNATNGTYEGVAFNNPFIEGKPKEHIIEVEDIKPTIKEAVNARGLRMDMFSEFAYDLNDNDETIENEEGSQRDYVHSYFFGKLRKLDFNLFEHAIENQPMTISFTSGDCGACNFEIGVTEEFPQKNPVLVNADGTLKRDEDGNVICGQFQEVTEDEIQDIQQDTINNEVWIALKKEEDTYGILMPKAIIYEKDEDGNIVYDENGEAVVKEAGHRPKACTEGQNDGDTFVILGINLPESYIINAEKKLEAEIIKYLQENNDEKFTFSINFSRIYFEENPDVLDYLNENSRINVTYNGKTYLLYVTSFSYSMGEGDVLPEIRVELDESLVVSQNALQNAINQVKSEVGKALSNIDALALAQPYFIRKDTDDEANGKINFTKGIKFGEGGKVEVLDNNSAKLTIEYLEVTKKASFTSLEIQEKTHVGGQILVTPAAITCGEVEELDDVYRCYFQTKGTDGDEIFNQFAVGDQAICQTYNAWGSKYYWRLVTGIGEDYIDLSKTECDEDSGIPSAGDKIIQLGNQADTERQNAIVIAAYGDGSPYIIQYKGINNFELSDDKIVTKLSSTENIFTGKVHMEMGSDGLGDMQEFVDLQTLAGKANTNATNAQSKANTAIATADMAQQSADTANKNALQAGDAANAATEKAEEAIGKAAAAQEGLDNMEIGGTNLLRNSGFTGDYLSEQLADQKVLEGAAELYSSPLDHWSSTATTVIDSDDTISGKAVSLTSGTLSQELYYNTVVGAEYVLSFKAKGEGILSFTVGDANGSVSLTPEMTSYEVVVTPTTSSDIFRISNATCTLGNLKLEKGNKATAWNASPLDNTSDRAYYQSMKYIQNAFEGATDIEGGLILTEQIWVGDYDSDKKDWVKMNGGMSGVYESDHDVAFWAGGNINQAIETVMMYADDPTYQPTEEELASMANFVVTHGGRAILNDAVVRGAIYANRGIFSGFVKHSETTLDATNEVKYISSSSWYRNYIDIQKLGGYVKVTSSLNYPIGLWGSRNLTTAEEVDEVRSTVGSRCVIVNKSGGSVLAIGDTKQSDEGDYISLVMFNNTVAYLECKARCDAENYEEIYWLITSVCKLK